MIQKKEDIFGSKSNGLSQQIALSTIVNYRVWALFVLLIALPGKAQKVFINEIMQSNVDYYMVDYDYPDSWVEIYNPTNEEVDISGYIISLDASLKDSYVLPQSTTVPAKGFLVIYCDKEETGLHTSFRLNSEGGRLYLYTPGKATVDACTYPAMLAPQVAFGRTTDGGNNWEWERDATPGQTNAGVFTKTLLPNPIFSLTGRIMNAPANVTITLPNSNMPEDTEIYYTTNGDEPTELSQHATSVSFDVNSSMVIRAKLMSASAISGRSVTQSYIFHPRSTTHPIISIVTDSVHFYDKTLGIFSSDTIVGDMPNFRHDWRRPMNIEYLGHIGDKPLFNQLGETAVSGASSRKVLQKSMKLYSNKRFGKKHFNGKLWDNLPDITSNKSIVIRNGGSTAYTYRITDGFIQNLFGSHIKNLDWQAYTPVITYINAEYAGIYGLRERSDEDYVWAHYDGLEDINQATNFNSNDENFTEFKKCFSSTTTTFADINKLMDVDEFANNMCIHLFAGNTDWPYNNVSMWKPQAANGKWRIITKDVDYVGWAVRPDITPDVLNFNYFKYLTITGDSQSQEYKSATFSSSLPRYFKLFQKLFSLQEFNEIMVDKLTVYLGDFLKPSVTVPFISQMRDDIYDELGFTLNKYRGSANANYFLNLINNTTIPFLQQRPAKVYEHMADFFHLGNIIPMTLYSNGTDVSLYDISLTEGQFNGAAFTQRAIRLNSGASNIGWKMTVYSQDEVQEYSFENQKTSILLADYAPCDSVSFITYVFEKSDFEKKLEELDIDPAQVNNLSDKTTCSIPEPRCAYADIHVDNLPKTSSGVPATIDFYDNNGNRFEKKILLSATDVNNDHKQGFSITLCEDEYMGNETTSLTIGDWVTHDEYILKGFYKDGLRGTAEIAYKLYGEMTSHTEYPRAFPCILYINGAYYGIMSWQTAKHRKNLGLDKENAKNVWLDGKLNDKQLFSGSINWTKFAVRNPKGVITMDGSDYNVDNPQELIDATSSAYNGSKKHVRSSTAKQNVLKLSNYNGEITAMEFDSAAIEVIKTSVEQRYDIPELINYFLFSLVTNNYNGFADGWQWFTLDGTKWTVVPYDCDLTFGYNEDGTSLWNANASSKKNDYRMNNVDTSGPLAWVKKYYWDEVKSRYGQLRSSGVISVDNIMSIVNDWTNRIGNANYTAEWNKWPDSPISDSPSRIRQWVTSRIALEDEYLCYNGALDVNKDGLIDIADVNYIISIILHGADESTQGNPDINNDGLIDVDDLNLIIDHILYQ